MSSDPSRVVVSRTWHALAIGVGVGGGVALNATLWALAQWHFPKDQVVTILHYSAQRGIDAVGSSDQLFVLAQIGAIIIAVNALLGSAAWQADWRVSWMLWLATPLLQLVLLVAYVLIWRINQ